MAEPPPAPVPPEDARQDAAGGPPDQPDRYGPLGVAHHAKDDGRELILYTWRPEE